MDHSLPRGKTLSHTLVEAGDTVNGWTFLERPRRSGDKVLCRCECGRQLIVRAENVLRGLSRNCRPCASRRNFTKHGASDCGRTKPEDRLYRIWKAMKWRCNPRNVSDDARRYHERGIAVCAE